MAFKLKSPNFSSPCRSTTPLHQNVSTNEAYSLDASGNLVKTVTNRTADRIIKGTPAPDPVITTKPGKRKKYTGMDNMCSAEYKAVYGSKRCDEYNSRPPKPPIDVPPTETIVEGEGTPDRIIPGTEEVIVTSTQRPKVDAPPTLGSITAGQGSGRSGIGNINIPPINIKPVDLGRFVPNISLRGIRNLVTKCKGGGCPKYYKR